ncbi:Hypothetical predicted protein [Olea europaea subsp. europaea]|uniref:Uncharacterized protein n=1 Tax=Olea europaea subsp. europaea TaxID=158383 RepID=A0A8S0RQR5_OLEEU|nr:Hypothetical predicted protein [Olea europaea subsp. europaea]
MGDDVFTAGSSGNDGYDVGRTYSVDGQFMERKIDSTRDIFLGGCEVHGGSYLVDGEQAREEGEIEEREANLNEDLLVTIDKNEQINVMATHIMERTEEDEGVKEIDEEIQEGTREHGIAKVDTIISDTEVEGTVEELRNIRDIISDFEQRAQ